MEELPVENATVEVRNNAPLIMAIILFLFIIYILV